MPPTQGAPTKGTWPATYLRTPLPEFRQTGTSSVACATSTRQRNSKSSKRGRIRHASSSPRPKHQGNESPRCKAHGGAEGKKLTIQPSLECDTPCRDLLELNKWAYEIKSSFTNSVHTTIDHASSSTSILAMASSWVLAFVSTSTCTLS